MIIYSLLNIEFMVTYKFHKYCTIPLNHVYILSTHLHQILHLQTNAQMIFFHIKYHIYDLNH